MSRRRICSKLWLQGGPAWTCASMNGMLSKVSLHASAPLWTCPLCCRMRACWLYSSIEYPASALRIPVSSVYQSLSGAVAKCAPGFRKDDRPFGQVDLLLCASWFVSDQRHPDLRICVADRREVASFRMWQPSCAASSSFLGTLGSQCPSITVAGKNCMLTTLEILWPAQNHEAAAVESMYRIFPSRNLGLLRSRSHELVVNDDVRGPTIEIISQCSSGRS